MSINQSIILFCPRAGLSLQTQHSPFYPLLSLPFRIFMQSIYHNIVYHLISSSASNFLPISGLFHTYFMSCPSQQSRFHHHQSVLPKGRSFTANAGTNVAVLLKTGLTLQTLASEQTLNDLKRSQGPQHGDEESGFR